MTQVGADEKEDWPRIARMGRDKKESCDLERGC